MPRSTSYMTSAQYEAYGFIDELEAEVRRVRHLVEKDWRGKVIGVDGSRLRNIAERFDDALSEWDQEDEHAPTMDEIYAKAAK